MNKILMLTLTYSILAGSFSHAEEHKTPISTEMFLNGVAAVEKKDFVEAVKLFTTLAESGETASQYNLSLLHYKGLGTP